MKSALKGLTYLVAVGLMTVWILEGPNLAGAQAPSGVQKSCLSAVEITKGLKEKFEQAPVAFGLQSNGNLLQVYASEDKGTWTVVIAAPNGMSCIVATGKSWETRSPINTDPMA